MRISIHALREEGDLPGRAYGLIYNISIHALREEGDDMGQHDRRNRNYFYPRPPRGGRRVGCHVPAHGRHAISIHALREEGDGIVVPNKGDLSDFYPRPPRGGRPKCSQSSRDGMKFLSTPSARRATHPGLQASGHSRFLSTPSARRATGCHVPAHGRHAISIHALREEGDPLLFTGCCHPVFISIHALREEGDAPPFFSDLYK